MPVPTANAVATLHMGMPAIYAPAADPEYVKREIEKLFARDIEVLSDNRPERQIWTPTSVNPQWGPAPTDFWADELLDWDAGIRVAPPRPSGKLPVTLEYAGGAVPSPTVDPWD